MNLATLSVLFDCLCKSTCTNIYTIIFSFVFTNCETRTFSGGSTTTTNVKKVDSVLYQGSTTSLDGEQSGIESVTWRGSLVAWADSR